MLARVDSGWGGFYAKVMRSSGMSKAISMTSTDDTLPNTSPEESKAGHKLPLLYLPSVVSTRFGRASGFISASMSSHYGFAGLPLHDYDRAMTHLDAGMRVVNAYNDFIATSPLAIADVLKTRYGAVMFRYGTIIPIGADVGSLPVMTCREIINLQTMFPGYRIRLGSDEARERLDVGRLEGVYRFIEAVRAPDHHTEATSIASRLYTPIVSTILQLLGRGYVIPGLAADRYIFPLKRTDDNHYHMIGWFHPLPMGELQSMDGPISEETSPTEMSGGLPREVRGEFIDGIIDHGPWVYDDIHLRPEHVLDLTHVGLLNSASSDTAEAIRADYMFPCPAWFIHPDGTLSKILDLSP